jgi:sarcosine oxidase
MSYDAIILGTGGVGSAAALHLARRGASVLGLDRFPAGHDRGSSHGETRIIRQAYFEHTNYVPLLLRAYELWRELEQAAGEPLLQQVGLLQIGPAQGAVISGVLASAREHHLAVELLSPAEISQRFPAFRVPAGMVGVFEPTAGYLRVERCVLAHLAAARQHGAEFRTAAVRSFRPEGSGVAVQLESGEVLHAGRLVVTAGPWAPQLLASLGIPLTIRRKHVCWFRSSAESLAATAGCPTFLYELTGGVFYGFPGIDSLGLKVAEHSGGEPVADPLADPRQLDQADLDRVRGFVDGHLAGGAAELVRHSVCFYTMSPDEHFLVDRHPEMPQVVFAAGLSGHGFKFTSVLGEALADLTLDGTTRLPIGHLSVRRFAPR